MAQVGGDFSVGFGDEVDGAGGQGLEGLGGALLRVRREHDHGERSLRQDRPHGFGAVHARHVEVHGDHVGLQRARLDDGVGAVLRLSDDLEALVALEDAPHGHAHERAVVHDQDPDLVTHQSSSSSARPTMTYPRTGSAMPLSSMPSSGSARRCPSKCWKVSSLTKTVPRGALPS